MTAVFTRILEMKQKVGLTWDQIARKAHIGLSSWMTGVPYARPTDKELHRLAPVLKTTYEWLKDGQESK